MRRKIGTILFIAFQALWLNVIVPGHTRGVVTLGGDACHSSATPGACCPKPSKGSPAESPNTPQKRAANCAICFYAIRMTPPPVFEVRPPKLELLEIADVTHNVTRVSLPVLLPYDERGPPSA